MKIKDFFYLSKSDRSVVIVLILLILAASLLFFIMGENHDSTTAVANADSLQTDGQQEEFATSQQGRRYQGESSEQYFAVENRKTELFDFDPNVADSAQFRRLGLQDWQIRNIYRYRAAGGIYRKPEDFARLYGLTAGQYRALAPHIRIGADYRPAAELFDNAERQEQPSAAPRDTLRFPKKLHMGETIPLNTNDTALLKRVPGIGSGFAKAVVGYGKRLGGYYSVTQLLEINNFPESALDYFEADHAPLKKINLNKLSLEQLRKHPYISFHQARAIADYRRLYGQLHNLSDLQLLPDFTSEAIERLRPYVEY